MRTLRSHLVGLALVIALPLVALAAGLLGMLHRQTYTTFEQGLRSTRRALTLAVDGELTGTITSLEGLATTKELDTDNLGGFHEEASRVLEAQRRHGWLVVVLFRPDGQQVVNTGWPLGSSLPFVVDGESFARVVEARQPAVGDFVVVPLTRRPNIAVRVPVVRDGRLRYVLTATVSTSSFSRLLQEQQLASGWRARVLDRKGITVGASIKPDEVVGTPGGAAYLEAAARARRRGEEHGARRGDRVWKLRALAAHGLDRGHRCPRRDRGDAVAALAARPRGDARARARGRPRARHALRATPHPAPHRAGHHRGRRGGRHGPRPREPRRHPGSGEIPVETWRERIHPDDRESVLRAIRASEASGTLYRVEHRVVRGPDDVAWIEGLGRFVYDETGAAVRMAGVIWDVTERHRHEEERGRLLDRERRARADAESANRAKDEFLAMLGHELRNPLGAITNAIGVLDRIGKPDEMEARARGVIMRQTEHLKRLVDDLLDVGRVMTGKIVLAVHPLDLAPLVRRCVDTLTGTGRTGRHTITVKGESVWVRADEVRIEQIVTNLVVNALKYTPADGTIDVTVTADDGHAVLQVRDSGVGIPAELLPRVFDLFVQGERTLDRSQAGLGIGLTLVRRLTELHGGTVTAMSAGPSAGSTFTVRLPRIAPAAGALALRGAVPAARRRILLVEDNDESREMIRYLLELDGHEVHEASDGIAGVDLALRLRPEVAVIDIGLPGVDGYEVARRIRAEAGDTMMLIALTGYGSVEDRIRTRQAGFAAHLVKPLDPGAVKHLLSAPGWPRPASESEDAAVQS